MSDSTSSNDQVSKSRCVLWIGNTLLVLAIVIVWGWNFTISLPGASDYQSGAKVGEVLGTAMLYGVISYLIYRFALKKHKGICLTIFFSLFLIASTYKLVRTVNSHNASSAFKRSAISVLEAINQGQPFDTTAISAEELGHLRPVIAFMTTYATEQRKLIVGMFSDLDSCFRDLLTPARLSADDEILKSRYKLVKADSLITVYESELFHHIDSASTQVESLREYNDLKQGFVDGFRSGCEKTKERYGSLMSIERRCVANMDSLLTFLLEGETDYYFDSSQIYFTTQDNADRYNILIEKIADLISEEQAWLSRERDLFDDKLKKLKNE